MRPRILSALALGAVLLSLASCSNYRHCQWRNGDQSVNDTTEYSLRFIESDDEGWFWDPRQVEDAFKLIRTKVGERDTIVVTFVHGWHHSAECCDGNVEGFRHTLAKLRGSLQHDFNVVGLYIGWRGQSLPMPLDYLTFWGRKGAAERVGQNDLKEFMARLQQLFVEYRPESLPPGETATAQPPSPHFLGMVTLGHSFGGQVLLKSVVGSLEDQLQTLNPVPAYLRNARPAKPDPDRQHTISGIGDLVVLVNPAAEASQYQRLDILSRGISYSELQTPVLLTVSAENDKARHSLFTIGRRFGEFFTGKPHKEDKVERAVEREALGVYRGHVSHQLVPTDPDLKLVATEITGDPRQCHASTPCTSDWHTWDRAPAHTQPNSLEPGGMKVTTFDFSGFREDVVFENVELAPLDEQSIRTLGEDPADYAPPQPFQPFIVARASRSIIDDHSGFFTQPFLDFLVRYIAYIEVKSLATMSLKEGDRARQKEMIEESRKDMRTK